MKRFFLISSLAFILLSGCKPDDVTPKDTTDPVITLTSPTAGTVRGSVNIKGSATDNTGIAKVEVYIDGTLSKTLTDGTIDFVWDSKTVTDGAHVIKIVATDREGNDIESIVNVTVLNTLVEFTVPENYIASDNDFWIFFSDTKGKVWSTQNLKNNNTYSFKPGDDFTDETVTVSIYHAVIKPNKYVSIETYANVSFGKYRFKKVTPVTTPVPAGSAKVTIPDKNDFSFTTYTDPFVSYTGTASASGLEYVFDLPKADHNKVLLFDTKDTDQLKYLFLDLAIDNDLKKSFASDFAAMTNQDVNVPVGSVSGDFFVRGFVNGNRLYFNNGTVSDFTASNSFKIKYPSGIFDQVELYASVVKDDQRRAYFKRDNTFPTEIKTSTASISKVTLTDNVVEYSATGSYDFVEFTASGFNEVAHVPTSWVTYIGDKASDKVTIPSLPNEIKTAYPETTDFTDLPPGAVLLYDYDIYKNYNDLITASLVAETIPTVNEYFYVSKSIPNPTARMSGSVSAPQPVFFEGWEGIRPN